MFLSNMEPTVDPVNQMKFFIFNKQPDIGSPGQGVLLNNDPAIPGGGTSLLVRTAAAVSLAVHLAIAAVCFVFSPTAFVVGAIGGITSAIVITCAMKLLGMMDWFKDSFLYAILNDVLYLSAGVATVVTATGMASGLISGVLCSLGGLWMPLAVYHDIKVMFAPVGNTA